jgi:hypothetical protein
MCDDSPITHEDLAAAQAAFQRMADAIFNAFKHQGGDWLFLESPAHIICKRCLKCNVPIVIQATTPIEELTLGYFISFNRQFCGAWYAGDLPVFSLSEWHMHDLWG